jgi:hypothetical protein
MYMQLVLTRLGLAVPQQGHLVASAVIRELESSDYTQKVDQQGPSTELRLVLGTVGVLLLDVEERKRTHTHGLEMTPYLVSGSSGDGD